MMKVRVLTKLFWETVLSLSNQSAMSEQGIRNVRDPGGLGTERESDDGSEFLETELSEVVTKRTAPSGKLAF